MRLWSLHPCYLDPAGLVALWRETLLARAVLSGQTRGYQHHPQLLRFRATRDPVATIDRYLASVYDEAVVRGYVFDSTKFRRRRRVAPLPVGDGQVAFEWAHLKRKLRGRNPARYRELLGVEGVLVHPIFESVPGPVAGWERP
ncbi:MAG TPA: pyrimidine dimer DNA glycosylase/endonuclease V [Gemmatimonadales bacterium]|jgi:hypothetical protein